MRVAMAGRSGFPSSSAVRVIFSSHRRSSTGEVSACVLKSQKNKARGGGKRRGGGKTRSGSKTSSSKV